MRTYKGKKQRSFEWRQWAAALLLSGMIGVSLSAIYRCLGWSSDGEIKSICMLSPNFYIVLYSYRLNIAQSPNSFKAKKRKEMVL